jgi:lipoprotein-releasing system ATP-binding protein
MNNIITINQLEKTYVSKGETLTILKDLSLLVPEGQKVIVVGESGSGKSTLLNIIAGIDSATKGTVIAGDWKISDLKEKDLTDYRANFLGLVFQFHYLLKDFTALENVFLPAYMKGLGKKTAIEKAKFLLEDVGLADRMTHLPNELSGGERQRVAVARALINDPKLILADEPTGNLDPTNATMISDLLFSMVEKHKKTLILVTHDSKIVQKGDVCYSIKDGKLVTL